MPFLDTLLKRGGGDFMKELAEEVLGRLMAYDVEGQIGAGRYERNEERTTQRNGFATVPSTRAWVRSISRSPSCTRARTSPASSSRAGRPSKLWWR